MGGGKKQKAPAAPDYAALQQQDAAANKQAAQYLTAANRPTQIDAWGNTLSWTQAADPAVDAAKADLDYWTNFVNGGPITDGRRRTQADINWAKSHQLRDAQANYDKTKASSQGGAWTQTQTLNPQFQQAQQAALDAYNAAAGQAAGQGAFQAPDSAYLSDYLNQLNANGDFDPNAYGQIGEFDRTQGDRVAADMFESSMSRLRPEQARTREALDVKLRLQGLQPGTEAYNRAMQNEMTSQGDVNAKLGLDATSAGYNAAMGIYNTNLAGQGQRFNQGLQGYQTNLDADRAKLQGALSTQQQQYGQALQNYALPMERAMAAAQLFSGAPGAQWQGFGTATGYSPADMTGAANANYQAKMGQYNAGQNKKGGLLGAGTQLGSAFLGSK